MPAVAAAFWSVFWIWLWEWLRVVVPDMMVATDFSRACLVAWGRLIEECAWRIFAYCAVVAELLNSLQSRQGC